MSAVVQFLEGNGVDSRGRTIVEVLSYDDPWLEDTHDYIQWLFPLTEASRAVPSAAVLTPVDIASLKGSPDALSNLRLALSRMASFYEANDHWLVATDYNHLRITRILKCTRLLLTLEEADAFCDFIMELVRKSGNNVSPENMAYWSGALA